MSWEEASLLAVLSSTVLVVFIIGPIVEAIEEEKDDDKRN